MENRSVVSWKTRRRNRIVWTGVLIGGLLSVWMGTAAYGSELGAYVTAVFRDNAWTRLAIYLPERGRVYVRIPNVRTGFLTTDQVQAVLKKMEQRLRTRAFRLIEDEGSRDNRWLVRGRWRVYDTVLEREFQYTVEIGWDFRGRRWQLVVLQTR